MKRNLVGLVGAAAAGVLLLSACGSSGGTAASTTTAATSAATSTAASSEPTRSEGSSSEGSVSASFDASPTGEPTTVGGNVTQLDQQSVAWFETLCGGLAGISELQNSTSGGNLQAAGQTIAKIGQDLTTTGQALAGQPAPTFEGGQELASNSLEALNKIGPAFTDFGNKLTTLDPNDQAAAQQAVSELQTQLSSLQELQNIQPAPEIQQAVTSQVPACQAIYASSESSGSAAPTS